MDQITAGAVIIGVVAAIKQQYPQIQGLGTILVAVVLGAALGYIGFDGLTLQDGIIAGIAAVGAHTWIRTVRK